MGNSGFRYNSIVFAFLQSVGYCGKLIAFLPATAHSRGTLVAMLNDRQHDILKSSGDCPFGATFGLTSELESFVLITKFIAWDSPSLTLEKITDS